MAPRPAIYLEMTDTPGAVDQLRLMMVDCSVSAVLLRPNAGHPLSEAHARQIVAIAQAAGAAALIADDVALASRIGADGVHLSAQAMPLDAYREARRNLGTKSIVGAESGANRHDAMELGEAGADYVAFSAGGTPQAQLELVGWWAEMFEIPCVALGIENAAHAGALIDAGADFLGWPLTARTREEINSVLTSSKRSKTAEGHTS